MKKNPAPNNIVDELLKDATPPRRKSAIDNSPELRDALVHFLDLLAAGDPRVEHLTFQYFYGEKLRPRFGGPPTRTAREYVRNTLKRSPVTGKHYGDET